MHVIHQPVFTTTTSNWNSVIKCNRFSVFEVFNGNRDCYSHFYFFIIQSAFKYRSVRDLDMTPFWIALQFLTVLPIELKTMPTAQQNGRAILFYPLVGLIIGGILFIIACLLAKLPILLLATIIMTTNAAKPGWSQTEQHTQCSERQLRGPGRQVSQEIWINV